MDESQAIASVTEWILWRGIDYPTDGLEAERFDGGWSVYAPVEIDESDPMAFLDMPIGRSVFLISDSGRIEESSSSVPPQQAIRQFLAGENGSDEPEEDLDLIEPIVQQLAMLGPEQGWDGYTAEFAFTVSSEIAQLRFWSGEQSGLVPVPKSIADLVRRQREESARMPAGPWWRMLLKVTYLGETTIEYDYGDEPFPDDQLVAAEHYLNDLETYPRPRVPVWLAGYVAGRAAQGRDPRQAALAASADISAGRRATLAGGFPSLGEIWARWAALSAAYAGVGSGWGPRMYPGYGWYESDRRSGSTLIVLPGERAVLSGGKWNSALLEAAYNGGRPLPDLYTGAPAWVNDGVLNTRNRNGLLSFCYWWANGRWHRGTTDTSGELDLPTPPIWTHHDTVRAMATQVGPGTEARCEALLAAAAHHRATVQDVAAMFANRRDADIYTAADQLSLAGLLVTR